MTANGFLEQKRTSPLGFGTVLLLHGAVIAAVVMLKGPGFIVDRQVDTKTFNVPDTVPPDPIDIPPPDTRRDLRTPPQRSVITAPEREIVTVPTGPTVSTSLSDSAPGPVIGTGTEPSVTREVVEVPPRPRQPDPVRVASLFDTRFGSQQPPYPPSEERAEREGQVRIRVTIGPDGRVTAAQRLSATNDAFWRATERQALSRWRFRPATLDGRPVQDSKVITIHFRLDGR